jgi:hypothetical protein
LHHAGGATACTDAFMQFELDYSSLVVLETKAAKAVTPHILEDNCIPSDRSQDLLQIASPETTAQENGPVLIGTES